MLHAGGKAVTREVVDAIPLPEKTDTYCPVPHGWMLDKTLDACEKHLPVRLRKAEYGLNMGGNQLFAVLYFEALKQDADLSLVIGCRNSYNKTLTGAVCGGAGAFVCDNLAFSGDSFTFFRRHTPNALQDLEKLIDDGVGICWDQFCKTEAQLETFNQVEMKDDDVFAALGVMTCRGLIGSTEMNRARRYWEKPPHEEHEGRNLFSFYQSVNHALKGAAANRVMKAHSDLHRFAVDLQQVDGNVWAIPGEAVALAK